MIMLIVSLVIGILIAFILGLYEDWKLKKYIEEENEKDREAIKTKKQSGGSRNDN